MTDGSRELEQAHAAFDRRAWDEAYARLVAADEAGSLAPDDLQRLAVSAFLTGRDDVAEDRWARAYQAFDEAGAVQAAARCAFWLGMVLITARGAEARGSGWVARAQRLVHERAPRDCAERGYVLLPAALRALDVGDAEAAHAAFDQAAAIGDRFDEPDLVALARLGQAQALLRMGAEQPGMQLLDEVMAGVDAARVSPITPGIVYCGVILACQQVFDVRRAQEWTASLTEWCADQPGLVPFRGQCLVHRSELARLRGDWAEAVAEADQACERLSIPPDPAAAMAYYQRAELHRLQGEYAAAESAFEQAAALGHDPHPGLALLWLDQGRTQAAAAAVHRIIDQTSDPYPRVSDEARDPRPRAHLLGACVEVMLAVGDTPAAWAATTELTELAESLGTPLVQAVTAQARGAVLLADDQPGAAVRALEEARSGWLELQAPYEVARTRVLIARALRELGDDDTAALEHRAAAKVFDEVGATPDLQRLDAPAAHPPSGLTARELEVVRLVVGGRTNREVAAELVISEKTVARHLHNVFTKLDLPNRSALTAFAYEHDLV